MNNDNGPRNLSELIETPHEMLRVQRVVQRE